VSTEHDLDHRFDYLFEPLAVVDADLAAQDAPQQSAGGESKAVPVALVASAVTAAAAIVALLQWPAPSNPAVARTTGDTQSTPSSTRSVAPDPPLVETPVASAVESRPQPQIAPSTGTAPVAGPTQPAATAPSAPASRPPALPTTRAPISVAPSSRAPLPYPNPTRDPSRPGGLLGRGGLL
jgi:hypothetical protein